jgi:hypothetical protein
MTTVSTGTSATTLTSGLARASSKTIRWLFACEGVLWLWGTAGAHSPNSVADTTTERFLAAAAAAFRNASSPHIEPSKL